jgi:biopolymer transport protein ExbD
MDIERSRQGQKDINMIPMINVIFLMLIFFLVGGTIEKFEVIHVEIPKADSGHVLDEGHVVIVLGVNDEILVNDDFVLRQDLVATLKEMLKNNPNRVITIKADSRIPATNMIAIMELVKAAGGINLSLVTISV